MYKVAVLLCTYNGEKHLVEQINSILNQTYKNIELYIRDDASTDSTRDILKKYEKYENVHIEYAKSNLGYPKCFYALTDSEIDADFFMFADQDDVWFPKKASMAVQMLSKEDCKKPLAYFANYAICDENLNVLSKSKRISKEITFDKILFEVCGLEFTMVINKTAKDLLAKYKPEKVNSRGTWMNMLYTAFGKIIYDDRVCAYYRRHSQAVTASNMSVLGLWKWRISEFVKKNGFTEYRMILKEFYKMTETNLSYANRKYLETFIGHKYFPWVLVKVFYPKRLRSKLLDELGIRLAFLFNFL